MMNVIIGEGLEDKEFIAGRTEGFEELKAAVAEYTPERVETITGIPAEALRQAARMYAEAGRAAIVYAMGITQHTTGTDNVLSCANLAMLTGNVGRPSTGVNPLRGQNNVQGACDLGGLPNVYPGYQRVTDEAARKKFEAAWGVELPPSPGLTVTEMIDAVGEGRIRALYVMAENPMLSDPDVNHVRAALERCEFLVVSFSARRRNWPTLSCPASPSPRRMAPSPPPTGGYNWCARRRPARRLLRREGWHLHRHRPAGTTGAQGD